MKKGILLIAVFLFSTAGLVQAEEGELGVTVDATWVSKYLWRGIDLLDDKAAFQPSVNFDLYGTGFSAKLWMSYAGSSKGNGSVSTVDATEYDYSLAYSTVLFEGERFVTNVTGNWIYYDFIDRPTKAADAQELGIGFSWPELCPAGIVPSYYVGKIWPARSNSLLVNDYGGWAHIFGLGYGLDLEGQVLDLSVAAVYNDGYAGAESDWSHIVWGISTALKVGPGTFTPSVYYQTSMEDTVNTEDEFWVGLSYSLTF